MLGDKLCYTQLEFEREGLKMALYNDVLYIEVFGDHRGETQRIGHYYRVQSFADWAGTVNFTDVLAEWSDQWGTSFWDVIDDRISTNAFIRGVRGFNLFSLGEVGEFIFPTPFQGGDVSEDLPPHDVYRFRHPTGRRGMHGSSKSFSGVVTDEISGAGVIGATALTAFNSAAAWLSGGVPINFTGIDVELVPVVVKRVRTGAGTPASPYKYRLPTSNAEIGADWYWANNWSMSPRITTQNSRKVGRGE